MQAGDLSGMRLLRVLFVAVLAPAALLAATTAGWSQTPPRSPQEEMEQQERRAEPEEGDTVATRRRPEYDPLGVRLGGFFLYPSAAVSEIFRDNIFYSSGDKDADLITVLSPALRLKSNWNVHALNLFADADIGRYAFNSGEDYNDWRSGFDGRVDIDRSMNIAGGFKYLQLHEARSSPDQTTAAEPVEYTQYGPQATFTKRFNRLQVQIGGELAYLDFDDATTRAGASVNMDDRDRRETRETVRLGYEIAPRYEAFVKGTLNQRKYDTTPDDSGRDRDSDGWETVAGVALNPGGVTFGNLFVGYMRQSYDDAGLNTVSGPSFGGDITWNPTRLTTVNFLALRTIEETTVSGASAALSSKFRATVDHELLRNVVLSAGAEYRNDDFEGVSRKDDYFVGFGGGDYLFNRHLRARLRYTYDRRDSDAANGDYTVNTVVLRLLAQY